MGREARNLKYSSGCLYNRLTRSQVSLVFFHWLKPQETTTEHLGLKKLSPQWYQDHIKNTITLNIVYGNLNFVIDIIFQVKGGLGGRAHRLSFLKWNSLLNTAKI